MTTEKKIRRFVPGISIIAAIAVILSILAYSCQSEPATVYPGITPYKIPATSFFAGSEDSIFPYTRQLGPDQLLTVTSVRIEWQPGLFPYPFAVVAKARLKNLLTGKSDDVEFAEDENWSHYE